MYKSERGFGSSLTLEVLCMKNLLYKNEYINVYETDGSYLATLEDSKDNLISDA